jgi:hypothetical protein
MKRSHSVSSLFVVHLVPNGEVLVKSVSRVGNDSDDKMSVFLELLSKTREGK